MIVDVLGSMTKFLVDKKISDRPATLQEQHLKLFQYILQSTTVSPI